MPSRSMSFCLMKILVNVILLKIIPNNLILLEIILINENSCKRHSDECHSAERHSDECHSAERHSGKCCGTMVDLDFSASTFFLFQ
jgi:hypothetical protein